MQLSLYDLWLSMGPFAKGIVVVMAVMSLLSWTQAFQKWWQIWRSQQETAKFAPEFSRFLKEEQLDGAIKLAEKQKRSHVARVVGEAASGGGGSLASVSSGIAEALITTAFGLMVAIPAVWLYNYFTTKIDFLSVEMTYTSKELIDYLIKSVGSEFGRSIFTKEFQTQKASQSSGPVSH